MFDSRLMDCLLHVVYFARGVGVPPSGPTGGWRRGIPILEMGLALASPGGIRFNYTASQFSMGIYSTSRNLQRFPSEKVSPVGV